MTNETDSTTSPDSVDAKPSRRKPGFVGRWMRRLFFLCLVAVGLLAALPWILTQTSIGDAALAEVSRRLPAGSNVGGLSLSWAKPVGVHDVAFQDGEGIEVNVREVTTGQSMLWMLMSRQPPEALTLRGIEATIDLDARALAASKSVSDTSDSTPRSFDLPKIALEDATIRITNGPFRSPFIVRLESMAISPSAAKTFEIDGAGQLLATSPSEGGPFRITGEITPEDQVIRCGLTADGIDISRILELLQSPPFRASGRLDTQLLVSRDGEGKPWLVKSSLHAPALVVQALSADSSPVRINELAVSAGGQYEPDSGDFVVSPFAVESDLTRGEWTIRGNATEQLQASLNGRLELLGPAVALADLPNEVQLSSVRFEPLSASLEGEAVALSGSIHWPECSAFGLRSNNGQVDYQLTPSTLDVSLANVPVGSGRAVGEYRIDLTSTPPRLEFAGGPVLQQIALTEQLCRDWLKYVSPTLANATDVRGQFGLSLNPLNTPIADGQLPDVSGQLLISSGSLQPGPLGRDIIGSIGSIGTLAGSDAIRSRIGESNNLELMRLPPQQVDFAVQRNIVQHRGFTLVSGNVTLQTAGVVNLDDRIDITARLTVNADAIRDKPILAGAFMQPVDIPIGGTINSPKIDRSAFKNFGRDAAAGAVGGLLQKLLDRKNRK